MASELWCWRRLLRVPWTARRSNQSILKEISPEYSLKGLMLKLKLQYFGHLMRRTESLEKTDAGKDWRQEEKGTTEDEMVGWHHRLNGHEFEQALRVGDGQGSLASYSPWCRKELDTTEWLNWNSGSSKIKVYIFLTSVPVHKEGWYTDTKIQRTDTKISRTHIFTWLRSCHPSRKRELAYAKWLSHLYSRMQDIKRKESTEDVQQLSFKKGFGRESHTPAYTLLARTTTQLYEARK